MAKLGSGTDYISLLQYWEEQQKNRKNQEIPVIPSTYQAQPQGGQPDYMPAWLRANPTAVFQSAISKLNRPMRNFFGSRFGEYYNKYLGDIANTGNQELEFMDWLPRQNFMQDYYSQSPYQRGSYQSRYAPRARFLNY